MAASNENLKKFKEELDAMEADDRRKTLNDVNVFLGLSDAESKRQPIKPRKLRSFSGAKVTPSGELEYKMWRLHAKPIVDDPFFRESEKKRTILDALLGEALEIASTLTPTDSSANLLSLLDKHFGDVSDGFELYSQFRSAIQESSETASDFLKRLHSLALRTVDMEGMKHDDVKLQVLRQFESNCADNELLQSLNLRAKFTNPDDVSDLLLSVRTEEARRKEKKLKLKARTARANAVSAETSKVEALEHQLEVLTQQLKTSNMANSSSFQQPSPSNDSSNFRSKGKHQQQNRKPGFGFCFNCGVDGHRQNSCSAAPNPTLVHQKLCASSTAVQGNGKR